jgi:hypothetical protein
MYLCSDNHDEVCYDSRTCPVCVRIEEIKELEQRLVEAETQIEKLEEAASE